MQPVENVSNYPRPPLIELVSGSVEIWIAGQAIAKDRRYVRVCELLQSITSLFSLGRLDQRLSPPR